MFNSITGILTGKNEKQVFVDTNGVEWDICVPDSNIEKLPPVGSSVKLYTYLLHTDVSMTLFGFSSETERALFFDLIKVDGIGAKGAVKIMSNVSSSQLINVLENEELAALEKIPGIGKKTAAKMLLALKGKLSFSDDTKTITVPKKSVYGDLIKSLTEMGYDKKTVEEKINEIEAELNEQSSFTSKSQKEKEDIIFRKVIVSLA